MSLQLISSDNFLHRIQYNNSLTEFLRVKVMPSETREAHVRFIYVEWALMTVVGWMTMQEVCL